MRIHFRGWQLSLQSLPTGSPRRRNERMARANKDGISSLVDRGRGRWIVSTFCPVSLFSLRMTHATSKGGKTLFVPTPYAVKMALIDACFRSAESDAEQQARRIFDFVKWSEVRVLPPEHCVVHNTFIKVLDYDREGDEGPFKSTIAYREFAFFRGEMHVAIGVNGLAPHGQQEISDLFWRVNTFGKRGSFWQCVQVT